MLGTSSWLNVSSLFWIPRIDFVFLQTLQHLKHFSLQLHSQLTRRISGVRLNLNQSSLPKLTMIPITWYSETRKKRKLNYQEDEEAVSEKRPSSSINKMRAIFGGCDTKPSLMQVCQGIRIISMTRLGNIGAILCLIASTKFLSWTLGRLR